MDKYSHPEQQQKIQEDLETEVVVEETPTHKAYPSVHLILSVKPLLLLWKSLLRSLLQKLLHLLYVQLLVMFLYVC